MPRSIFISYVYEDKNHRDDVSQWAQQGLLGQDIVTVVEHVDMRPQGDAAIESHLKPKIRGSAVVLGLIGADTHNHDWVRYELKVATSLNKKIVIARIPGTTGAVPEDFRHLPVIPLDPSSLKQVLAQT